MTTRIKTIRCANLHRKYSGEVRNTQHAWQGKNYILLEIESEDGVSGFGEMYCDGGGSPEAALAMLRYEVAPALIGKSGTRPLEILAYLRGHFSLSARGSAASMAISAVDIAMWDMVGKRSGLPLYRLLGGHSDRVKVYASGGMYGPRITPQTLAQEMREAQAKGLNGAKIKIGGATLEEDVARVTCVREAIGPHAPLMVDAMFRPNVTDAIRLGNALKNANIHFYEAPTNANHVSGWRSVGQACGLSLSGPELSDDRDLMLRLLQADALQFLQFDVAIAGGVSEGREIFALARAFRKPVTLHCAASAVAMAAAAQMGAGLGGCDSLEFHLMHDGMRESLWKCGWRLESGHLVVPDRPGLGVEPTDEVRDLLKGGLC